MSPEERVMKFIPEFKPHDQPDYDWIVELAADAIREAVEEQSQKVADLNVLVASKEQSLQFYKDQAERLTACISAMPDVQKAVADECEAFLHHRLDFAYKDKEDDMFYVCICGKEFRTPMEFGVHQFEPIDHIKASLEISAIREAVAEEREACALIADGYFESTESLSIAKDIRARSETPSAVEEQTEGEVLR